MVYSIFYFKRYVLSIQDCKGFENSFIAIKKNLR